MKGYNGTANPTIKIQERVYHTIKTANEPLSVSKIAELAQVSYYQAKAAIEFLERFKAVKVISSSGGTSLVFLVGGDF